MSDTVEHPELVAKELEALKTRLLFSEDEKDGTRATLSPMAEQFYLEALAHLELAVAKFRLSNYHRLRDW